MVNATVAVTVETVSVADPIDAAGTITVPAHTYSQRQLFSIICSLTDDAGNTATAASAVVFRPNVAPTLDCSATQTAIAGDAVPDVVFGVTTATAELTVVCTVSDTLDDYISGVAFLSGQAGVASKPINPPTLDPSTGRGTLTFTHTYIITDFSELAFTAAVTVFDASDFFARVLLDVTVDVTMAPGDLDGDDVPDDVDST